MVEYVFLHQKVDIKMEIMEVLGSFYIGRVRLHSGPGLVEEANRSIRGSFRLRLFNRTKKVMCFIVLMGS